MEKTDAMELSRGTLGRIAKEMMGIDLEEEELAELEKFLGEIKRMRELEIPEFEPATLFLT